jgi:hypothetical protein
MTAAVSAPAPGLLSDARLIDLLCTEEDRLSSSAAGEFVRRADRMLDLLADLCRDENSWRRADALFWTPVHASYLLGAIGDERGARGLLASLRWSVRYDVDWVWEMMPSLLGGVGRPVAGHHRTIVRDPDPAELDRALAVHCLAGVAVRHPVEQGGTLDFLKDRADDEAEEEPVRNAAAWVLFKFARPGDRKAVLGAALRQRWGDREPSLDLARVRDACARGAQDLDEYRRDWMAFYREDQIAARQKRWREEVEGERWARAVQSGASWVERSRERLLREYEAALSDLGDQARGEALWVADSMTEYLSWHEGLPPWRWTGPTAFSYLMDFFSRRVGLDDPGRIGIVPDGMVRFIRFCRALGHVAEEDRLEAEERVASEREDFVGAALDPARRRQARSTLERLVAAGEDPAHPSEPPRTFADTLRRPPERPGRGTGRRTKR